MNALLVSVPRGDNDEKNSHSVLSSSIDNLLDSARNALFALHSLVTALGNENYTDDAVEGMLLLNNHFIVLLTLFITRHLSLLQILIKTYRSLSLR